MRAAIQLVLVFMPAAIAALGLADPGSAAEPNDMPRQGEHAQPNEQPHQIIEALAQRLYAIGETTSSIAQALEAEKAAADRIREYATAVSTSGLIEANEQGQTPLIAAALNGYPQVVAALLESDIVRRRVDAQDSKGGTAWLYANMALRESISACNPSVLSNVFAWEPVMVNQFYYLQAKENPYRAVRRLLASKGAHGTLDEAKRFWIDQCKREDANTKERIEQSKDVLDTALGAGAEALSRFLIELQKSQRHPPPLPTPGTPR
jgi:hypothetical protein